MRPVSAAFNRTVKGSHRMFARARVLVSFQSGTAPTGYEIPIITGDVQADASADIRSTLTLTTTGVHDDGSNAWPLAHDDLLAPYGNELFVERGINYGNGTIEVVSLGYFRINRTEQQLGPQGPISLSCADRMAGIIDARLTQPVQFLAGTSIDEVFDRLVLEVYPDATIEYDFDPTTETFAQSHVADEDRYGFLNDVARSNGKIMFWDYRGVLMVISPPDPGDPVYEVASGRGGVLVQHSRQLDRQGVYNAVVARGESPGSFAPVSAFVYDDNPQSPTYWNGRFGRVPRFYYSSFITTTAQASAAAQSMLKQAVGLPYRVDFTTVPNPALEVYDSVRVSAPDTTDIHVIETLSIPLTWQGDMPATTRKLVSFEPGEVIN